MTRVGINAPRQIKQPCEVPNCIMTSRKTTTKAQLPPDDAVVTAVTNACANPRIAQFCRAHPALDIEQLLLRLIDLLESSSGAKPAAEPVSVETLADTITAFQTDRRQTAESLATVQQSVADIAAQMQTLKQEYLQNVSAILTTQSVSTGDKIAAAISRGTDQMIDRTTALVATSGPKHKEAVGELFRELGRDLSQEIRREIGREVKGQADTAPMLALIEQKCAAAVREAVRQLESDAVRAAVAHERVAASVGELVARFQNSSHKGKMGESNLAALLSSLYPSAEVRDMSATPNSGDLVLVREGEAGGGGAGASLESGALASTRSILFENKDYCQNVDRAEVAKFLTDVSHQKMSAVFVSQSSGISFKKNYQIDVHEGRVLVYLQNCQYNADMIRIAVDIIDALEPRIWAEHQGKVDQGFTISSEDLEAVNREYQMWIGQRDALINTVKDHARKTTKQIQDSFVLPTIDTILRSRFAAVTSSVFACDLCGRFRGNTRQSLAAHQRCCKKKSGAGASTTAEDA